MRSLLIACAAWVLPGAALAQSYVRAGVGYDISRETHFPEPMSTAGDFGGSPALGLGLGRRMAPFLRLELEGYWRPDLDFAGRSQPEVGGSSLSGLAMAYADFGQVGRARPFLGVGAGVARNRLEGEAVSAFAWSGAVGVAWRLSNRTVLDASYRYADLGRMRSGAGRAKLAVEGLGVSLRRGF